MMAASLFMPCLFFYGSFEFVNACHIVILSSVS